MITLVRKGRVKTVMFSVRLSMSDYECLKSLLKVSRDDSFPSMQFRSLIRELEGRLHRDSSGNLVYTQPKSEIFPTDMWKEFLREANPVWAMKSDIPDSGSFR